ncbi:hypothetical protein COO60DRAFT_1701058 [Scenedesmus sp. NREL 46B-D3]|nr:hypothetical protein COO60DRAFT_1701058 [Scenedesmus sp. NREL 46B-D3]
MQDACDGCLKPHSDSSSIASSRSMCEDDSRFRIDAPTPSTLPPSTGFTQHVQKSMEAHDAAQQLRQAAEVEAQAFFEAMGAAPGTGTPHAKTGSSPCHPQRNAPGARGVHAAGDAGCTRPAHHHAACGQVPAAQHAARTGRLRAEAAPGDEPAAGQLGGARAAGGSAAAAAGPDRGDDG